MVAAAVIGGSVASAAIGANASGKAASQQGQSAQFANNYQLGTYLQNQRDTRPYIDVGQTANAQMINDVHDGTLGGQFTPDSFAPTSPGNSTFTQQDFQNNLDPGYGFQLNQGQQALQNSQAAQNGVMSGSALKGLIDYNQGAASTGYQNAYNRWLSTYNANQSAYQNSYNRWAGQQQNRYNVLSGLSNLGANTAVGAGTNNVSSANGASNAVIAQGNAQAAGTVGTANAINSGISNGSGYMYLNSLMNNNNSSYDTGFNGQNNATNQAGLDNFISGLS